MDRALAVRTGTEMLTEIRDLSVLVKKIADIILIYMYINIEYLVGPPHWTSHAISYGITPVKHR